MRCRMRPRFVGKVRAGCGAWPDAFSSSASSSSSPGDFFGEIALTMSTKRIADAKSLGSVGGLGPLKSEMR